MSLVFFLFFRVVPLQCEIVQCLIRNFTQLLPEDNSQFSVEPAGNKKRKKMVKQRAIKINMKNCDNIRNKSQACFASNLSPMVHLTTVKI